MHEIMKFGNVEAVGRLQIRKKKYHENAAPLKTLVGLIFQRKKIAVNTASTTVLMGLNLASSEHCKNPIFSTLCLFAIETALFALSLG